MELPGADSAQTNSAKIPAGASASKEVLKDGVKDGQEALARFQVPRGFKAELIAAEPMLANPVALSIDSKGRFYVAETFRLGNAENDIRSHPDWLPEDLASQSVKDRVEMMTKHLGDKTAGLTKETDRIRLLVDTNGDGKVDVSSVFAEGFNHMEEGLGAGVLAWDGGVYYADVPNLWRLQGDPEKGKSESRESLLHGFGVRIGYWGHDLHGLRMGPDGRLYFSMGDRGARVPLPNGQTVGRADTGAIYRCNPDGSDLELVAWGLRNPQDLAFDRFGNLWTVDNNSDSGEPARLVYVVEGGDSGWRIGYQFLKQPTNCGPWLSERLWEPQTAGGVASVLPAIATITNSGAGLAYYPGLGFSKEYQDRFFVCTFHGSPTNSGVQSFSVQSKGASFEITNRGRFIWNVLATDVEFGFDGCAYITDWVDGWRASGKGRIYRVFDDIRVTFPSVEDLRLTMASGFQHRKLTDLVGLLTFPDMRVRQAAQFALAGQGEEGVAAFANVAQRVDDPMARLHAVWGLGQCLRSQQTGTAAPSTLLTGLLRHGDSEVRAQTAKVLGESKVAEAQAGLVRLLKDAEDRPRFFAAIALGRLGQKASIAPLLAMIEKSGEADRYLLHAGVMGLTGCAPTESLAALSGNPSQAVRLAAVLALRRQGRAEVAGFLQDNDATVAGEAARAIHDAPITEALSQLAALIVKPLSDTGIGRRVINANFRLGGAEQAAALAQLASQTSAPEGLRLAALECLGDWATPPGCDRVTGQWNPLSPRTTRLAGMALQARMEEMQKDPSARIKAAAARAVEKLLPKS